MLSLILLSSLMPAWANLDAEFIDPADKKPIVLHKWSSADDDDDGPATTPKTLFFHSAGGEAKPGGPWLGIQFGPVSKPLAAQLRIDAGSGQMVTNVVEGSPADTAGLQQYDVIVNLDGTAASSSIEEFMSIVRAFKPGESHNLTVVRNGQRINLSLVVGARPDEIGPSKYKSDDEELSQGNVFGRSGMLQKDDKGNWVFKGFNMPDLPDFWKAIPAPSDHDFLFNVPLPGGKGKKIQMYMKAGEGKTTRVEKAEDGKITVITTTTENGKESTTTKTYNSEADLEAADPDAAKMLKEGPQMRFNFSGDGKMHFNTIEGDLKTRIEEAMKNAEGALKGSEDLLKQLDSMKLDGAGRVMIGRKAKTSFEVTPDGKVKVTTRKGDDEITTVYDNADALRQANPEQFRKFERLQDSGASKKSKN